jgi:CheY-like chemotaxis protein
MTAVTAPPRMLVVEDHYAVRSMIVRELTLAGFDILQAADAEQGLALLEHFKRLDLLFTDIRLPGVNGWKLAETIRAHHANVAVIYTSGYAEPFLPLMRSIFLEKPYLPSQVIRAAAELGFTVKVDTA